MKVYLVYESEHEEAPLKAIYASLESAQGVYPDVHGWTTVDEAQVWLGRTSERQVIRIEERLVHP